VYFYTLVLQENKTNVVV